MEEFYSKPQTSRTREERPLPRQGGYYEYGTDITMIPAPSAPYSFPMYPSQLPPTEGWIPVYHGDLYYPPSAPPPHFPNAPPLEMRVPPQHCPINDGEPLASTRFHPYPKSSSQSASSSSEVVSSAPDSGISTPKEKPRLSRQRLPPNSDPEKEERENKRRERNRLASAKSRKKKAIMMYERDLYEGKMMAAYSLAEDLSTALETFRIKQLHREMASLPTLPDLQAKTEQLMELLRVEKKEDNEEDGEESSRPGTSSDS